MGTFVSKEWMEMAGWSFKNFTREGQARRGDWLVFSGAPWPEDGTIALKVTGRGKLNLNAGKESRQGEVRYLVNGTTRNLITEQNIHANTSVSFAGETILELREENHGVLSISNVSFDCAPPAPTRREYPLWGTIVQIDGAKWEAVHPHHWGCDTCVLKTEDARAWGYNPISLNAVGASLSAGKLIHASAITDRSWCATVCRELSGGKCTGFAYPLTGSQCYIMSTDCKNNRPSTPQLCQLRSPWGGETEENVEWDFYTLAHTGGEDVSSTV